MVPAGVGSALSRHQVYVIASISIIHITSQRLEGRHPIKRGQIDKSTNKPSDRVRTYMQTAESIEANAHESSIKHPDRACAHMQAADSATTDAKTRAPVARVIRHKLQQGQKETKQAAVYHSIIDRRRADNQTQTTTKQCRNPPQLAERVPFSRHKQPTPGRHVHSTKKRPRQFCILVNRRERRQRRELHLTCKHTRQDLLYRTAVYRKITTKDQST